MKNITSFSLGLILLTVINGCKNRDINEGEAFKPREIHEDMIFHFDKIDVDGIEYLILEKDNNNPHEGFGFMAFRANKLMEKQDSMMAYMKAIHDLQVRTYAASARKSLADAQKEADELLAGFLEEQRVNLERLSSTNNSSINPSKTEDGSSSEGEPND